MRNRVRIDVEKAVRRLERTQSGLESARELVSATTEARRVTGDQVEAGTANRSALLEADAAVLTAQADLLRQIMTGRSHRQIWRV